MVRSRSDIASRQYRVRENFLLNVQVVLHDVVVHLGAVVGLLAAARKPGHNTAAEGIRDGGEQNLSDVIDRRVEQISNDDLHFQWQVCEGAKAAANRGFPVAKNVPRKSHSRLEVPFRYIVREGLRYMGETGVGRRMDKVIELAVLLDRIGFEVIAQAEIENEVAAHLKLVLNVRRQIGVTHIARRVVGVGWNTHKCKRLILQKRLKGWFDIDSYQRIKVGAVVNNVAAINDRNVGVNIAPSHF